MGWHKVNFDASIREGQGNFQIGMVMSNARGDFVAGINKEIMSNAFAYGGRSNGSMGGTQVSSECRDPTSRREDRFSYSS